MKKIMICLIFSLLVVIGFNKEVVEIEAFTPTSEAIETHSLSLAQLEWRVQEAVRILNEYEATIDASLHTLSPAELRVINLFYMCYGWAMDSLESFNQTGSVQDADGVISATFDAIHTLWNSASSVYASSVYLLINSAGHNLQSDMVYITSLWSFN